MDTKKYIIEIPDNTAWLQWVNVSDKDGHVYFDFKDPEDLIPYTAPDLEQVREEAKEEGYRIGYDEGREAGVQQGLADAWEAARKISSMDSKTRDEIFDRAITSNIFDENTASEAIEKIRQYELEKELEQLQEGVEKPIRAEDVMRQYLYNFCEGRSCNGCLLHTSDFTCGRGYHFLTRMLVSDEEVRRAYEKVMKEMREE